jgi:hypothetical protein
MNDAVAQGLGQFQSCIKLFRNHIRNLARGRELRERLAAAEILILAHDEQYVQLPDLCEEVRAALSEPNGSNSIYPPPSPRHSSSLSRRSSEAMTLALHTNDCWRPFLPALLEMRRSSTDT